MSNPNYNNMFGQSNQNMNFNTNNNFPAFNGQPNQQQQQQMGGYYPQGNFGQQPAPGFPPQGFAQQ